MSKSFAETALERVEAPWCKMPLEILFDHNLPQAAIIIYGAIDFLCGKQGWVIVPLADIIAILRDKFSIVYSDSQVRRAIRLLRDEKRKYIQTQQLGREWNFKLRFTIPARSIDVPVLHTPLGKNAEGGMQKCTPPSAKMHTPLGKNDRSNTDRNTDSNTDKNTEHMPPLDAAAHKKNLFEKFCELAGMTPSPGVETGKWRKGIQELANGGCTVAELRKLKQLCAQRNWPFTPTACMGHLGEVRIKRKTVAIPPYVPPTPPAPAPPPASTERDSDLDHEEAARIRANMEQFSLKRREREQWQHANGIWTPRHMAHCPCDTCAANKRQYERKQARTDRIGI